MTFVADVLASWLIGKIAEESSRRAITWVRGPDQKRALRQAADAAIRLTAAELSPDDHERAEQIEMVIGQVFGEQLPSTPPARSVTLLEAIRAGIARQLAILDDPEITGIRWSSAELLHISVESLKNSLTNQLVREIIVRGAQGGPLTPLATQINHDVTHLQGQRVEGVLAQLIQAVQEALAALESSQSGMLLTVTHTLPADVASFTGRQADIQRVMGALPSEQDPAGVVRIDAIDGMAGIGKTAFAVHIAHRLGPRFPDGQLFLRLHAHTPGRQPQDPADALSALLLGDGLSPGQIPPGLDQRAALWRDRMAARKVLLVLDDAASTEQVLPLLPASAGSLVLITSRRHLTALPDTLAITLDLLDPAEGSSLFTRVASRAGLSSDDADVREISELCAYLPLAITLVAGQLKHHRMWTAADVAAQLQAADRLEHMAAENISVAAALDLSYRHLPSEQQQLFRRLGLHPGTDIDAYAAAALNGTDFPATCKLLEGLFSYHLIEEPAPGRYGLHDLIRRYARSHANMDPADDRDQALERLFRYYHHTAAIAEDLMARYSRTKPVARLPAPAAVPDLLTRRQALVWARAERANLLACLSYAASTGNDALLIALTVDMATLLRQSGPWTDAITCHLNAVQTARRIGDRLGEANARFELAVVQRWTGDYTGAAETLEKVLEIAHDLGDKLSRANALKELGVIRRMTGNYPGATKMHEEALSIHQDIEDKLGQANALRELGVIRRLTGNYPGATQILYDALGMSQDIGDQMGKAQTLSELGLVQQLMGDYGGAAATLEDALAIFDELGERRAQLDALIILGLARHPTGDYLGAIEALEEALRIARDLGDPLGQANAQTYLGTVRRMTGGYQNATEALDEALAIFRDIGDRLGQGNVLSELGTIRRMTGDYQNATEALDEALAIFRDIGERLGQAEVLNELGRLTQVSGDDTDRAGAYHQQALDLARQIGSPQEEAHALAGLGRCAWAANQTPDAEALLRQALEILERIGAAEAVDLADEIDSITDQSPPRGC